MSYFPMTSFIFVLLLSLTLSCHSQQQEQFEKGESSYHTLRSNTEDGTERASCMKVAFSQLNATCANLDDAMVSYLALRFTVCHYQDTQREFPEECINATPTTESTAECTKLLSECSFVIYTQFYTHTLASCYFLEAKLWQERTEQTIHKLGYVADASAIKIEESLANSDTLIKGQKVLNTKASELSDKHDNLHEKMENNHQKMDELTKDIGEYHTMVYDILSALSQSSVRLEKMVNLVLGETHQLSSFLFYFTISLLTFLLTIPSRTNGARIRMISFIVIHFLFERLLLTIISYITPEYHAVFVTATYYTRFSIIVLSLFLLFHTGYHYKDYEMLLSVISNKLDKERKENEKFREDIHNEIKISNTSLHDRFDLITKPYDSPQDKELLVPSARRSIHRIRRRLDDEFGTPECVSDYNTPWRSCLQSEATGDINSLFSPVVALDYDSGVEDCSSRKKLELSIHKLDIASSSSPSVSRASTPRGSISSRPVTNTIKRYNLRSHEK